MHPVKFFVAIVFCLAATQAHAAGFRFIEVAADAAGPALNGGMWYPCAAPPGGIDLGEITEDCPISGDKLPLVVSSHGRGADFSSHYDLAETLADAGFVVAAVTHPGDRAPDETLLPDFVERPVDIKRLIDFMLAISPAASSIDPQRIGFFGFSFGGYTGLVLIGANLDWTAFTEHCQRLQSPYPGCEQVLRKEFPARSFAHDPRIKAAVVADPPSVFFTAASLAAVEGPVQLWASERGGGAVTLEEVAAVDRNLPAQHEYHVVPNSWHGDFVLCPPGAKNEFCRDAPGFGRAAFHKEFNAAVLAFFQTQLGVPVINPGVPLRKQRRQIALSPEVLTAYAGTYTGSPEAGVTIRVAVRARGSRLFVQATGEDEYEAFPETETRFFLPDVDADIIFVKDAAGNAASLVVHHKYQADWRAQRVQ
jgi:predicted dienelactone hydrolase